jgi:hypothetical protein
MYEYIRSGTIRQMLGDAKAKEGKEGKTAEKARKYVVRHIDDGMDWRKGLAQEGGSACYRISIQNSSGCQGIGLHGK